ncbi:WhiB family transcriptional regulator [Nocardia otitidiscaviarum]|uniref:WhiB family transcriptional regulator n=1 Tax=Nocardia otitidiscaviarum TaxID=1823 RepID=UPI001893DD02|nr:WhiB family transcriptional regulator [Nocardia otitidiscaviarum]MBF6179902.1 WhiB family transcriptional regulator [Nocardia otitidiscaviarum]
MRKFVARKGLDPHFAPERSCAGLDTELFFPLSGADAGTAQRVCWDCPVLARCADWALRAGVTDGVVASVWLPGHGGSESRSARYALAKVAATGRPYDGGVGDDRAVA